MTTTNPQEPGTLSQESDASSSTQSGHGPLTARSLSGGVLNAQAFALDLQPPFGISLSDRVELRFAAR